MMSEQFFYLMHALNLAKIREGFCAPNPAVGAIVVKNHQAIASGYHWGKGYTHAEVDALNKAHNVADATLYVTLEPCCHSNKTTPPCTDLIISSGIKKLYFGYYDPNPAVAGQGIARLRQAGIECHHIPLAEIDAFYQPYQHWQQHKRPWVTAKLAISLDGAIADTGGKPVQITGKALQRLTHHWRKHCDAILTTVKTVIADNPQMNVRLADEVLNKPVYILDRELKLPLDAKIIQTAQKITLFHDHSDPAKAHSYQSLGINCVRLESKNDRLSLMKIIDHIGHDGMHHLWVEAGASLFKTLLEQKQLHQALLYIGNIKLGDAAYKADITISSLLAGAKTVNWQSYDDDVLCHLKYE